MVILTEIKWYILMVLICISYMISGVGININMATCVYLTEEISIQVFALKKIFFHYWLVGVIYAFGYRSYIRYMTWKYFLLFSRLLFQPVECVLWCKRFWNFIALQFIDLCFYCLCFWCHTQETEPNPR